MTNTTSTNTTDRKVSQAGLAVGLVGLVLVIAAFLWFWPRLPEPMATHWSFSGRANGSMPRVGALSVHMLSVLATATLAVFARSRRALGMAVVATLFMVSTALFVLFANLDHSAWQYASLHGAGMFALLAVAVLSFFALVAQRQTSGDETAMPATPMALREGEYAAWFHVMRVRGWLWLAAALTMVGLISLSFGGHASTGIILLFVAAMVAMFAVVRVRAGADGVVVAYGPYGLLRQRIPLASIVSATTAETRPLQYGGYGYRRFGRWLRNTAVVLRNGECLRLTLEEGRVFLITVDHATEAASLLTSLKR